MELEGKVRKTRKGGPPDWLAEVPALDIMTQGYSREEAIEMLEDAIVELMRDAFRSARRKSFYVTIQDYGKGGLLGISASDTKLLAAFVLRRQRRQGGLSVREAAERLGSTSPNAYAKYEQGQINITFMMYDRLLNAANPTRHGLFIK